MRKGFNDKLLYQLAKTMLKHRSGTLYEDMYWIDAETATVVAKEVEDNVKNKIVYSKSIRLKISKRKGLVTIHTHPSGSPPSFADLCSNYAHEYSLGIICGHNGNVYVYTANEEVPKEHYDSIHRKFNKACSKIERNQMYIWDELQKQFDIVVKEVK